MNRFILTSFLFFVLNFFALGQNVGVGTTSPQAKLHVNGTFKLQNGVIVNGISNDTTFSPGSDSLLVTQLAVKRYAQNSDRFMLFQELDSTFQGNQTVALYPDSMVYASPDGWQSDSALNVFTTQGNVGIDIAEPTGMLHINGSQKIEGAHTLTLGSGLPDWEINAAKIGYGMLTPNGLDIVGAGPTGNKKIKLWHESFAQLDGNSIVGDTAFLEGGRFDDYVRSNGNVGIGVMNPTDELTINGSMRLSGGIYGGHIAMNGSMGPYNIKTTREGICWGNAYWPEYLSIGSMRILKNSEIIDLAEVGVNYNYPIDPGLNVRGNVLVMDSLIAEQGFRILENAKITGNHTLELGAFIPGKEVNAGKIGYETFTPGALDIVGAGTSNTNRKIKMWAEYEVTASGNVVMNGSLNTPAIKSDPWEELGNSMQNNWENYGGGYSTIAIYKDPEGVVHMRGLIKDGLNQQNTVIVTLPPGYRPIGGHQLFEVINGVNTFGRIDVETDGDVVFRGITNTFLSLDQVVFKTN